MSDPNEAPQRRRRQSQPAAAPQGSVSRGAVLVLVAVVIGFLLLRDDDTSVSASGVGADVPGQTDDGGDGTDGSTTTSTTVAARAPSQVKVLVANGSGVDGAAGSVADQLEALGYVTATPTNAERVPATVVYFTAGYQAEAEALAEALGAAPTSVTELPAVAPVSDMQLSNVLVVVGADLASGATPTTTG